MQLPQFVPQRPQFSLSPEVFTQVLLQLVRPELHSTPHVPPLHTAVPLATDGHTFPHLPQFCRSLLVFTQLPPQALKPL